MTKVGFTMLALMALFLTVMAFAAIVALQFGVSFKTGPSAMFLNVVGTIWFVSFLGHVYESFTLRPILR